MAHVFILIYAVILIISGKIFKRKYGYLCNAIFLTTAIWCIFASIAAINPIGLRPPVPVVHIYSILFLLSFNICSYVIRIKKASQILRPLDYHGNMKKVNKRIVIVEVLCLIILAPMLLLGIEAILSGNAADYRFSVYFGSDAGFFTKTIPVAILSSIMVMSLYFYFNNKSKGHLVNSFAIVLFLSVLSSGRDSIFCFLMIYIFMNTIYRSFNIKTSKLPIYIGVTGIIVMTVSVRGGNMLNSLITYFSGSFSFLDYILANPRDYGLDTYHYGMMTLSPITEPLMYILKVIRLTTEKIPSYYLNLYVQDFVDIGATNTVMFNNNTTALLPFILDGGWIGVVFGGWFLAFLASKTYSYFVTRKMVGGIMYLYVVNGMFMTTISYQSFISITPLLALLVIYYCVKPCLKNK